MKKIPVWQTIAESYRFTFMGLERVIGVIWLPVLIMTTGAYFVSGPYLNAEASALDGNFAQFGPAMVSMFTFELVMLVLAAVIAVAITREILSPLKRPLFLRFSLGAPEMRLAAAFVGLIMLMILFFVVCIVIAIIAGSVLGSLIPVTPGLTDAKRALAIGALVVVCLSPVLIFLCVRLGFLVVPSVVMDGKFGIERSWQLTRGNVWRIIAVVLAVSLPLLIVTGIVEVAILGPDYFRHSMGSVGDKAEQARHSAEQIRLVAAKLPFLMGLSFVLAPFSYGLTFAAPAFAYRALTGEGRQ
jgi:hypothetical protein